MTSGPWTRRTLVVAAALVVALLLIPGLAAGYEGAVGATLENGEDPPDPEFVATDPLANATEPTEVIVRFTPIEEIDADDPAAVVEALDEHAAEEQSAFESLAERNESVTVEREFWLANAMLVTVDPEVIDASDLRTVNNVTAVHENVEIETFASGSTIESTRTTATQPTPTQATATQPTPTQATATQPAHHEISHQTEPPQGPYTTGLELIGAPAAWDRFDTRGAGATVAVIDTGVDPGHQDINLVGWARFDDEGALVSSDVANASDPNGHGTHVAGTVAGGDASGTHIGVAPDAGIYGIDTFGADGTATFASVLAGMEHATADEQIDVLQMSLGASGTFGGFIRPVRNARAADQIVVAASGNEGHETSSSPANVYDSLAVGAIRNDRSVAVFSSGEHIEKATAFGEPPAAWPDHYPVPDVTAPGVDIVSAEAGTTNGYVRLQGTSMAAPHVTGVAALAIAATEGRVSGDDLQASIIDTAVHPNGTVEPDDRYGHGVIDAESTVEASLEAAPAPTPTPTPTPADTETPEPIEPATDDGIPGFGVGIALVALLLSAAAVGVSRR